MDFTPGGGVTKPPSSNSQVSGRWKVEKTQDMTKAEVEQLLRDEGDVDREGYGDGLQ